MTEAPTISAEKPKILVIDDSEVDRELSTLMLEENGFAVVALNQANQCMEAIANEKPNLVLLDIMMPGVDGNQALQQIRQKYSQVELPVIMATSKSDASDVIAALNGGANDYVVKPIQFEIALRRIQTHLTMAKQSRTMVQASELMSINAMISTYNHEINNPLAIAIGALSPVKKRYPEDPGLLKIEKALWRISDIIKKTNEILQNGKVKYTYYADKSKMVSLQGEDPKKSQNDEGKT